MRIFKTNITLLIAALLMIGFTSCEDYLDVNKDPNNPTEVAPDFILPLAQVYTAHYLHSNRRANHLGNMFMYNWSEAYGFSWYNDEFQYQVNTTFYAALFDDAYTRPLKQYNILTNLEAPYQNYVAIGMIMKALHFQYLVDIYGDVPYSEALQRSGEATPKYDDARAIYDDLLVKLDEAVAMINTASSDANSVVPGADDTMFGGNMTDWKRFAHTLKVRILTRMSDVADAGFISGHLATIQNEGSGFIGDDVIVDPGYLNEEGKQNPFWTTFGWSVDGTVTLTNDATAATDYIIDYLQNTNDPRIDLIYEEPATGHAGVPQGIDSNPDDHAADVVSNIGPGILKAATMGAVIFTEAEHHFNLAELALKGMYSGNAESLYYSGIEASFDLLGATGLTSYTNINAQNVNWAASGNKLQAIITQKWIATNGFTALQSWFDYNRTGFPASLPVSAEASTNDRPVRLFYPASERASNPSNVPAQADAFTERIFWAN